MSLRRRLALLASGYLALLVVAGGSAIALGVSRTNHEELETTALVNVERVEQLKTAYTDMETGERGFLLGGASAFLEPYANGNANVERLQASLTADLDTPELARALTQLQVVKRAGESWMEQAALEIATRQRDGQQAAEALVATQIGKQRFDEVRAALVELGTTLEFRRDLATEARQTRARQLTALTVAIPALGFAMVLIGGVLINRWVVHPLRSMDEAVDRVRAGDLSIRVPSVGAYDVARFGANIDRMRATIVEKLELAAASEVNANRAREAIEQSATLVLQLRTELASELGTFPEGWTAAAELVPAEGYVAGDCYDVTLVSPHQLGIIVVDIAGHGAVQAIAALKCKEILRAALRVAMPPGEALQLLSDQVDFDQSFVTAFVALVDTRSGICTYANGGHPPALLNHDGSPARELMPTGPLIGPFPGSWRTEQFSMEPGGKLVVYTDGLSEARDAEQAFYGTERLARIIAALPCQEAEPVLKSCLEDLAAFTPQRLADDVTMVLVCRICEDDHGAADAPTSEAAATTSTTSATAAAVAAELRAGPAA